MGYFGGLLEVREGPKALEGLLLRPGGLLVMLDSSGACLVMRRSRFFGSRNTQFVWKKIELKT